MGSLPFCSKGVLCCSSSGAYPPKSDLFVPQISLKITKKKTEKKVKSLKTYTINKKSPLLGRMTTERFIYKKAAIKKSITMKSQLKILDKLKIKKHPLNRMQTQSFVNRNKLKEINENYNNFRTMKI